MGIVIPFTANFILTAAAYIKKSVSISGAFFGFAAGFLIYFCSGIKSWILLLVLFIITTVLSKFKKVKKKKIQKHWHAKDERRDMFQIAANIGPGAVFVIIYYFTKNPIFLIGFAGSFAASTADTCSSEMGILSKKDPISIIGFRKMEAGESGGITMFGTMFGLFGSLIIAFSAFFCFDFDLIIILIVMIAGFIGSNIDSILGELVQVKYICSETGRLTERSKTNGKKNKKAKGLFFVNNDLVNFFCTISGGFAAIGLYFLIFSIL